MQRAESQSVDLREYLAVLRARKWTILLVAGLVVASALFFSFQQTAVYSAKSRLLVEAISSDPEGFYAIPPTLETEIEVLKSTPVAELVKEDLGTTRTPAELLGGLSVDLVTDSDVLVVNYSSTDPAFASEASNSFARNYIQYRREQALEALLAAQESIEQRLEFVQEQLADLDRQIRAARGRGDNEEASILQTQRTALIARLGVLQQQLSDVQPDATVTRGGGQVIEPAQVPTAPSSPDHMRNGLLAGFLGLALGIGLAFLRERLDDRFRGRTDVERAIEAPVIATIPRFKTADDSPQNLVTLTEPKGTIAEGYRSLRTNLQFLMLQRGTNSILVTSASASEGKTVTSTNLGVALAQAGQKVVLVSADMRKPTLEKYFKLDRSDGLSTWLMDIEADAGTFIKPSGVDNLSVFPAGAIPHNPAELLTSPRMNELTRALEQRFDFVIFDAPPVLPVADAPILASNAGGTVLVIDGSKTTRSAAQHAKEELERVGGQLVGVVLNAFDPSTSPYYYESYYRYTYEEVDASGNGAKTSGRRTIFGRRS